MAPIRNAVVQVFALGLVAWHAGAHAENVAFKNDLADCVAIKVREISMEGNLIVAHTVVTLAKSTSECGCKSLTAIYTSSVDHAVEGKPPDRHSLYGARSVREELQTGLVILEPGGEKVFVLASDPGLIVNKRVTVTLGCAPPL